MYASVYIIILAAVGSPCESSPCEQVCNEYTTSYQCSCLHGYVLHSNGINCVGKLDIDNGR